MHNALLSIKGYRASSRRPEVPPLEMKKPFQLGALQSALFYDDEVCMWLTSSPQTSVELKQHYILLSGPNGICLLDYKENLACWISCDKLGQKNGSITYCSPINSTTIIIGTNDGSLIFYDLVHYKVGNLVKAHLKAIQRIVSIPVYTMTTSCPDFNHSDPLVKFVSYSTNGCAILWSIENVKEENKYYKYNLDSITHKGGITSLTYDLDNNMIITYGSDKKLNIYDLKLLPEQQPGKLEETIECKYQLKNIQKAAFTSTTIAPALPGFILACNKHSSLLALSLYENKDAKSSSPLMYNLGNCAGFYQALPPKMTSIGLFRHPLRSTIVILATTQGIFGIQLRESVPYPLISKEIWNKNKVIADNDENIDGVAKKNRVTGELARWYLENTVDLDSANEAASKGIYKENEVMMVLGYSTQELDETCEGAGICIYIT